MQNTLPYKLLIFDWDGTLIDSAAKIVDCLRVASLQAGLDQKSNDEYRFIIGLGIYEAIDHLYPGLNEDKIAKFTQAYRQQFLFENNTTAVLFDGVLEMLNILEEQGYYLAIATGKSRRGLDSVLQELNLKKQFHASRCADETLSKPNPLMLEELLLEFDVSASQALMIGDTEFDINMAHNANMQSIAVTHGAHSLEHLQNSNPLAILDDVTCLPEWLNND